MDLDREWCDEGPADSRGCVAEEGLTQSPAASELPGRVRAAAEAAAREELASRYAHRVGFFAVKVQRTFMLGSRFSDELESAGYWGLFKALENRRPEAHERELSAYVSQRIHGAVIDAARNCINHVMLRESVLFPYGDDAGEGAFNLDEGALLRIRPSLDSRGRSGLSPCVDGGAVEVEDPERKALASRKAEFIEHTLGALEADDRQLLRAYMEGSSMSEIARDEGLPLATLQGRFRKIARRLRAHSPELRRILLDRDDA